MSERVRLTPDNLRHAATAMTDLGSDAQQSQQTLERAWVRLDAGWDTYAEAEINGYYNEAMNELSRMAAMLAQLGQATAQTANIIEAADRSAASFFNGLDSSAGYGGTGVLGAGTLPQLGGVIAPTNFPDARGGGGEDSDPWWKDLGERIRNWLSGKGWVTDEELAASMPAPEPEQPEPEQPEEPEPTQPAPEQPEPEPEPAPTTTERITTATPFLYLRANPTTSADAEAEIPPGATVQEIDGVDPVEADGHTWVQVTYTDADGVVHTGWVAEEFLGEAGEVVEGGALSVAPVTGAVVSGWDYGDKEYKIPAGTVIGDRTYTEDTVIDPATFNALSPADQAKLVPDQATGQYIIPAGTTLDGITYSKNTYIGEAEYNALNSLAEQGEINYIGMHPGVDISGSDTSLEANAAGAVYMYQAWKDEDGNWQYTRYDPANADNNQANADLEGFGNYLVLETTVDGQTYYQIFAHLDGFDANLTQGQTVEAGTALGTMGSTGNSTGNHIHWEIRTDAGIDQGNNHGISVWFPATSTDLDTNFVDPDTFAALLAAQAEETSTTETPTTP